jgi:hypothetical protein
MQVATSRLGGSDAIHAATWRVTAAPLVDSLVDGPARTGSAPKAADGASGIPKTDGDDETTLVLEAYDRPGMVLSLQTPGDGQSSDDGSPYRPLVLEPAREGRSGLHQRWRLRTPKLPSCASARMQPRTTRAGADSPGAIGGATSPMRAVTLESAAEPGVFVIAPSAGAMEQASMQTSRAQGALPLEAAADADTAAVFQLGSPLARYPPLAMWAHTNVTAHCSGTRTGSGGGIRSGGGANGESPCRARHFLMVPLRDVVDETYAAHICVLPPEELPLSSLDRGTGRRVPDFC